MFSVLAQVSFTISGLLAIAIAGDADHRNYWFNDKTRSLFLYFNFLLLLLPGFISVGGLIPSYSKKVPTWPYIAFFWGVIYIILSIIFFFRKKKAVRLDKFARLEKKYSKINTELGFFGIITVIIAAFSWGGYMEASQSTINQTEMLLGVILWISTLSSVLQSVDFLRSNKEDSKRNNENNIDKLDEKTVQMPFKNKGKDIFIVTSLIVTIIAFVAGLIVDHRNK